MQIGMVEHDDVTYFTPDDGLCRNVRVYLVIKGFHQRAIRTKIMQRRGDRRLGLTALDDAQERRYSTGLIANVRLDHDSLTDAALSNNRAVECTEPYDVSVNDGESIAYTAGNRIVLADSALRTRGALEDPWMSYLHTARFSADGSRILTSSAGFDMVLEHDVASGERSWAWSAWDHGYSYNARTDTYFAATRRYADHLRCFVVAEKIRLVDDPAKLPPEGVPTFEAPMRINGAVYDGSDTLLITGYHRSDVITVARQDKHATSHELGLRYPHCYEPVALPAFTGFMVCDSGRGKLCLLNRERDVIRIVNFSRLDANTWLKSRFGEWLQSATLISADMAAIAVVDTLRSDIHVVDVARKRRRSIAYPSNWTVQRVIPVAG